MYTLYLKAHFVLFSFDTHKMMIGSCMNDQGQSELAMSELVLFWIGVGGVADFEADSKSKEVW